MFSNCTLHLGQLKTGTTALQKTLQQNRDLLLSHSYVVVESTIGGWGNVETACIARREETRGALRRNVGDPIKAGENFKVKLRALAQEHKGKHLILSCEHLFRDKAPERLNRIVDFLREVSARVEGIVYLRNPLSLVPSAWAQGIKTGTTLTLDERLSKTKWLRRFDSRPFEAAWRGVLDELKVVEFGGDSIDAFRRDLGLPELERVENANLSLGTLGVEVLLLANKEGISAETRKKMVKYLVQMGDEKVKLTPEQEKRVRDVLESGLSDTENGDENDEDDGEFVDEIA